MDGKLTREKHRAEPPATTEILKTISPSSSTSEKSTKKRHRLRRSTDNFDSDDAELITTRSEVQLSAKGSKPIAGVMGGGFVTPPTAAKDIDIENAVTTVALITNQNDNETTKSRQQPPSGDNITHKQMHEKLLENDGCDKTPPTPSSKGEKVKHKPHKESKFAEKLRRSFRRAEHKSLEIKRQDKIDATERGGAGGGLRPLHQQLQNSASIFSLTNLPGLGGHINPALLLDSPDESTPPEFAYRHLSSVATTNSSTSLESNFCESPTTSISYWAWHMNNNNSMGGEVSTNSNPNSNQGNNRNLSAPSQQEVAAGGTGTRNRRLEQQSSSKSDQGGGGGCGTSDHPNVTADSRSCSTASESSTAAKLTRLQNFLFKSSNESSRSIQGHSNEGFTISSFNSSSGEWENLCNFPSTSQNLNHPEDATQFPLSQEEETVPHQKHKENLSDSNGSLRNYYQYTLASPSNPFLPEITARTYHSTYEEEEEERDLEEELDSNVTSVKYRIGCHSAQLPTPNYSRTGSQESTHSEYAGGAYGGVPSGLASSTRYDSSNSSLGGTSTPGKHKRKLFSLSTPTKLDFPHTTPISNSSSQASHQSIASKNPSSSSSSCNLVRSLNPFLPSTTVTSSSPPQRTASSSSLNKQQRMGPFKQQAVTSPIAIPPASGGGSGNIMGMTQMSGSGSGPLRDLNARREEFLKATMQICLVVSPPSSRLQ
ncbi:uncharacterized protein DDB_G0283357-like, partial [Musca vetustissima]|uniref:uncharacterized protein DDB_G0283357-like n=1 Tax=Musca vetustissima TaxID=27455 RepID=UPI002AB6950A